MYVVGAVQNAVSAGVSIASGAKCVSAQSMND